MQVQGACHCGQIRFEAEVDPEKVALCHCSDCQVFSGTVYRVSATVPAAAFRLLSGTPKTYVKTADSGGRRRQGFCANCGTPISACDDVDDPPSYSLRVGCMDQRAQLPPRRRLWRGSALDWAQDVSGIPGVERQ